MGVEALRPEAAVEGLFGGALLLTALSTLLSGLLLPAAVRSIIFGGLLAAVVALRERAPA